MSLARVLTPFLFLAAILTAESGKTAGNPTAPVRIELFSDYQCPQCKVLHDNTMRPLIVNYVNTGKVYLVNREFPLTIHPYARDAACVACAADKLGKYEVVADQLFRTQERWSVDGNFVGAACSVLSPADAKKLMSLLRAPDVVGKVNEDIRAGEGERIDGTPTMIITRMLRRYPVRGAVSYEILSKFIDSLLK